mgnify:CR=1 FL=1|jgi:ABC-type glycerol-3-phosphate transport system substrate-binding protein
MKKSIKVLLTLLVLSFSISAVELEVWMVGTSVERIQIINEIIRESFTPQTGIDVKISSLPWAESDRRFQLAVASGDAPDTALMSGLLASELGVRGAMVDLKQEFGSDFTEHTKNHFPGVFNTYEFMGAVFGIPFQMDMSMMAYRLDLVQELGIEVPNTWQEVRNIVPKLQAKEMNFALVAGIGDGSFRDFSAFLWQNGGAFYSEDRLASAWDLPESIKGFTEYTDFYTQYKIPQEPMHLEGFRRGELPITCLPYWVYANMNISLPELKGKWDLELIPGTMRNGKLDRTSWAAGTPFAIFKNSKHKKEAWEFVKFMTSPEFQGRFAETVMTKIPGSIHIPTASGAYNALPLPDHQKEVLLGVVQTAKAPPFAIASEAIVLRHIEFAINKVVLQKEDPQKAILEAATNMNSDLKTKYAEYNRFIKKYK